MTVTILSRALAALAVVASVGGCASMGSTMSLFDQLGGMDSVRSLSDAFVSNVASDNRTSNLVSGANMGSLKTKMSDQLCALSGGGCKAPLTGSQIAEAGKKVDAGTSRALNDSLSKALDTVKTAPGVREGVTKLVGPQLGGIVAGLL
jgi:hemoglobin